MAGASEKSVVIVKQGGGCLSNIGGMVVLLVAMFALVVLYVQQHSDLHGDNYDGVYAKEVRQTAEQMAAAQQAAEQVAASQAAETRRQQQRPALDEAPPPRRTEVPSEAPTVRYRCPGGESATLVRAGCLCGNEIQNCRTCCTVEREPTEDVPKGGCVVDGVIYDATGNVYGCSAGGNWCSSSPPLAGGCVGAQQRQLKQLDKDLDSLLKEIQ